MATETAVAESSPVASCAASSPFNSRKRANASRLGRDWPDSQRCTVIEETPNRSANWI